MRVVGADDRCLPWQDVEPRSWKPTKLSQSDCPSDMLAMDLLFNEHTLTASIAGICGEAEVFTLLVGNSFRFRRRTP